VPICEVVSQISPPIRILLVLAVAVMGVYMLFLRPKPVEVPPATPAGTSVSDPGKIRDAAEDAVDAANGQLAQQESVDGVDAGEATASATATGAKGRNAQAGAAGKPGEDLSGLPKPVQKAIRKDKVLVILFSNGKSADDRAVEDAMKKVDRWNGRVYVHTAPLKQISKYGRIARGVSVEQSPTVVVADRDLRAETLVGYSDRTTIDQAVVDARRNSTGLFTSSYLRQIDKVCVQHSNRWHAVPFYYFGSQRQAERRMKGIDAVWVAFAADFKAVDAPKKWRSFHKASVADLQAYGALVHKASVASGAKASATTIDARITKLEAQAKPISKRANRRFKAEGLLRCGSQF
jgi:hypothetical protein